MSIREDARNAALVREALGFDINELQRENVRLKDEVHYLKSEIKRLNKILGCFNGSNK